jgi:hypothetical protein
MGHKKQTNWELRMEAIMEKASARAKPRASVVQSSFTLSAAEQEMIEIDALAKRIISSKKESVNFLKRAGILNSRGMLAKAYR